MLDRLKHWFNSRVHALLSSSIPPAIEEKSTLEQCLYALVHLDVDWYRNYQNTYGSGLYVETPYKSLDLMTIALIDHRDAIRLSGEITRSLLSTQSVSILINRFFVSHDGYYQNVEQLLRSFQTEAILLCKQLQLVENATSDQIARHDYNLRLLTPLLVSIKELCLTLMEIKNQHT